MRSSMVLAALPALAQASFFDNLQAKVGEVMGNFKSAAVAAVPETTAAVVEEPVVEVLNKKVLEPLTLENWQETLYEPVEAEATIPEQWWVFVTGGNKTCGGVCAHAEGVFNETAAQFAKSASAPHTAIVNCDNEPILCSALSASPGGIWSFDMLPPPAPIEIHARRLNLTTVSVDDLLALEQLGSHKWMTVDGVMHPFDGWLAQNNLLLPAAQVLTAFGQIPQWAFMLVISFATRYLVNRRMPSAAAPAAPAAAN